MTSCYLIPVGLVVACALGCQPHGPRTYPVAGTVTYDRQPIKQGDIIFVPENPSLAPDAGKIVDGRFEGRAKEGRCRVEISALNIGPNTPVMMGSPIAVNYIPEKYNVESELSVEVSATGENEYEFDLTSR